MRYWQRMAVLPPPRLTLNLETRAELATRRQGSRYQVWKTFARAQHLLVRS